MDLERVEPQEHRGWLCLTKGAERITRINRGEAFSEEIEKDKGFYDMVNRAEEEGQMRDMMRILEKMEEGMELVKGKLQVGTIEEIERAQKVEEGKQWEKEEKRKIELSKAEGIKKAKAQKLIEEKREKAEEAALAEETRQEEDKAKREQTLKFQREEIQRLVEERQCMGSTSEDTMTWAERMSKGKKTLQRLEEENKSPSQEVSTGSGWEVKKGKAMRSAEITTHFWSPLTEEEKKSLLDKVRTVSELIDTGRKTVGKGSWTIKVIVDMQVCFNDVMQTVSRVVRNTNENNVRDEMECQAMAVVEMDKVRNTWIRNCKSVAIFIRGARGESKDRNEEVQEKLEAYNPGVQWGNRKAVATRIGAGEWEVKAEV